MPYINESGLFAALESALRNADEPLDCVQLFDLPIIREHAKTVNRVSDYLGNLWRKGLVVRLPAPKMTNTKARWLYQWKDKNPYARPKADLTQVIQYTGDMNTLLKRPSIEITEEGNVITLTMPHLSIVIRQT